MTIQTKKQRLREEAKLAMWNYYKDHKPWLPKWIGEYREEILSAIQSGRNVEVAFNQIIEREEVELALLDAA